MWQLRTSQGVKLFGYRYMSDKELKSFTKQIGNDKFDEGINRGTMLKYIPKENISDNWIEVSGFSLLIILLLTLAIVSFKQAKRAGQF